MDILTTSWKQFPDKACVNRQVFALSDIHGCSSLLERLINHLENLPVLAERVVIFTGDIVDRGPDAIGAFRLVMDAEKRFGNRILLPGNHEQIMLEALIDPRKNLNLRAWHAIGGHALIEQVDPPPGAGPERIVQAVRDALPDGLEDMLLSAPSHHVEGDLWFVHAGLMPGSDQSEFLAQSLFDHPSNGLHWAWIRRPFLDWTMGWDGCGDIKGRTIVVHGHTVEIKARFKREDPLVAAMDRIDRHRRINLDIGAFHFGQMAALEACGQHYRFHIAHEI